MSSVDFSWIIESKDFLWIIVWYICYRHLLKFWISCFCKRKDCINSWCSIKFECLLSVNGELASPVPLNLEVAGTHVIMSYTLDLTACSVSDRLIQFVCHLSQFDFSHHWWYPVLLFLKHLLFTCCILFLLLVNFFK